MKSIKEMPKAMSSPAHIPVNMSSARDDCFLFEIITSIFLGPAITMTRFVDSF
jgi:hypothetical protein